MRADLQSSQGNVVSLLSEEELIDFYSEAGAKAFLNQFIFDPSNMETMRRALGEELGFMEVAMMTDQQVIDELAIRLARTCVAWTKVDILPTISAEYSGAEPDDSEQEAAEALSEEQEHEEEDVKPKPVIPPEYPLLAKREGDAIKDNTENYNLKLDLLRYVGLGSVPEAKVPEVAQSAGYSMAKHVLSETLGFGGSLLALARAEDTLPTETEIGAESRALGKSMRHPLVLVALAFAQKLRMLLGMPGEPMDSEVAAIFQLLCGSQGDKLIDSTQGIANVLNKLFGPAEPEEKPEPQNLTFSLEGVYAIPMADERYCVEFPDGRRVYGQLDQDGFAKLEDVGEGPFKVSFPSVTSPWKIVAGENPEMNVYKIVSGDTLGKIAKQFSLESWVSLYEHDANESFRKRRPNPNKIQIGDQIYIPDQPPVVWELRPGEPNRCRLIDPLNPELADDTRIWIKYIFQKGNDFKSVANAHENVKWDDDIFDHPRNADLKSKRKTYANVKVGDVFYIPVPDKPYIRYEVQEGDWLSKIGDAHEKEWQKDIYCYEMNAEFKEKHPNPDIIYPGEVIYIPLKDLDGIEFVTYEVKPCDYLERIGYAFGVDWKADIYDHWRNAAFKTKRPDPTLIYPGDVLYIQKDRIKKLIPRPVEEQFKVYTIKKGDSLSLIAANQGLTDWKADLYEHPVNATFRKKRSNPNLIYPDDQICIPLDDATGWVEFEIVEDGGQPVAGLTLQLELGDGQLLRVTSDENGKISLSEISDQNFKILGILDQQVGYMVNDLVDDKGNHYEAPDGPGGGGNGGGNGGGGNGGSSGNGSLNGGNGGNAGGDSTPQKGGSPANNDNTQPSDGANSDNAGNSAKPGDNSKTNNSANNNTANNSANNSGTNNSANNNTANNSANNSGTNNNTANNSANNSGANNAKPNNNSSNNSSNTSGSAKKDEKLELDTWLVLEPRTGKTLEITKPYLLAFQKYSKDLGVYQDRLQKAKKQTDPKAAEEALKALAQYCHVEGKELDYEEPPIVELMITQKSKAGLAGKRDEGYFIHYVSKNDYKKVQGADLEALKKIDASIKKEIDELEEQAKKKSINLKENSSFTIKKEVQKEAAKALFGEYSTASKDLGKADRQFDASASAAFVRFAAGVKGTVEFDPKKGLNLTGYASAGVDLVKGKAQINFYFPNADGVKYFEGKNSENYKRPTKGRLRLTLKGDAGVGAIAEVHYGLVGGITKQEGKRQVSCANSQGFKAFAGASISGTIEGALEWNSGHKDVAANEWSPIISLGVNGALTAGAGAEGELGIGYDKSKGGFFVSAYLKAAVGVGAGLKVEGSIDPFEVVDIVNTIIERNNFDPKAYAKLISQKALEEARKANIGLISIAAFNPGVALATVAWSKLAETYKDWNANQTKIHELAGKLNSAKAKQLLRTTNPAVKGEFIYQMTERCIALSDETEEEAVINILSTTRSKAEAYYILTHCAQAGKTIDATTAVDTIDRLVDWKEQDLFDNWIKKWFGSRSALKKYKP